MPFVEVWQDFLDALVATTLTAWPEVADNGVWQSTQSAQTAYDRAKFPKAVLEMVTAREGDWGGHNIVWEQPVAFWYIARDGTAGDSVPFREKLKLVQDQIAGNNWFIDAPAPSTARFQCIGWEMFDVNERNEANVVWMARDAGYLSGYVAAVFLVGDTPV